MELVVNGQFANGTFRIDDLQENLVGMDFLKHPFAIARNLETAQLIVEGVNNAKKGMAP